MDSVMDFVNISSIYHATQKRQLPHYQTIKDLKRGNVRDVRDKKRKKVMANNACRKLPVGILSFNKIREEGLQKA